MNSAHAAICELRKSAAAESVQGTDPTFIRRSSEIPSCDPLDWLEQQPAGNRMYWQGRDGEITAGSGAAHLISGKARECAQEFLGLHLKAKGDLSHIRYFGGLSFDKTAIDPLWEPFERCRFQLPEAMIAKTVTGKCTATAYRVVHAAQRDPVDKAQTPAATTASTVERCPDANTWQDQVQEALKAIEAGTLQKVVLAGRTGSPAPEAKPFELLRALRDRSTDAFVFAFEPIPNLVFIGASPERLYRRDGISLSTEALAGTRKRGTSPEEDTALAEELLHADKDHREQQIVLRELLANLKPLCQSIQTTEKQPKLLRQATVQHLVQHVRGTLNPGVLDHEIIRAIHPTPAVGGRPRPAALEFLHRAESFSRGWYAAPVGWLSPKSAEFAVAIRSALIANTTLYTFAGAGIVEGSIPSKEWDEIQQKQKLILDLLS